MAFSVDFLRSLFSRTLGLSPGEKVLDELTLDGLARYILSGKCELTSQMSPVLKDFIIFNFNMNRQLQNKKAICRLASYCTFVYAEFILSQLVRCLSVS